MRSWTGPVVVGVVLGLGFAVANDAEESEGRTDAPGATGEDSVAAQLNPTPDQQAAGKAGHANTASGPVSGAVITFDDGPHGAYTPQILDILDRHDAVAVFCVVGRTVDDHPGLVQRIVDEGHVLCNHTYTHDGQLRQRSSGRITDEVARTRNAIETAAPSAPVPYFRQPTMFVTEEVGAVTDSLGYQALNWTIDSKDWTAPGADAIVRRVVDRLRPGAVILLHDGGGDRADTVEALPRILDAIADAGLGIGLPE